MPSATYALEGEGEGGRCGNAREAGEERGRAAGLHTAGGRRLAWEQGCGSGGLVGSAVFEEGRDFTTPASVGLCAGVARVVVVVV